MINRRSATAWRFWLGLIVLAALIVRCYHLGTQSYWIDEMVTIHFAGNPSWQALFWDNNPFPFFLVLKVWMALFGRSEVATRALSVVFSVATTVTVFFFGLENAGLVAAAAGASVQALLILSIKYAQETRMYAFFEFASALNMFFFFRLWLRRKSPRGYAASSILVSASHYLALVPLILQIPLITFSRQLTRRQKVFLWTGVLVGLVVLVSSYLCFFSWPYLEWQKYKFAAEPNSHQPLLILWNLADQNAASVLALAALVPLTLIAAKVNKEKRNVLAALFYFVAAPILIFQAGGLITHRGVFLPRYLIFIVPPLSAWIGLTVSVLIEQRKALKAAGATATALYLVGGALALPKAYWPSKSPWRDAAKKVGDYPKSYGLTSRTKALQSPYFDAIHVEVDKLDFKTPPSQIILEKLKSYDNVWVIENYYGGIQYMDQLKDKLESLGLKTEKFSFSTEISEPVFLLRVYQ